MDLPRLLLLFSTLAFLGAVVQALAALRAGRWQESRWHLVPMAAGFALQTGFLYLRGQQHGRCPLTNQFEVFIFIGWCIMLLYFLVGAPYRLSLLGVFTAPLLAVLQMVALIASSAWDAGAVDHKAVTFAGEFHKTIALIGYAAFALACITGVMFLLQDRLLKRHHINALFHQLPPIHDLSRAIARMILIGVVLLGAALSVSLGMEQRTSGIKVTVAWGVWLLYAAALLLIWLRKLSARHTAVLAITGFCIVFVSIWIVAR
jgi:ABC-type uncharacterized transport system permease subunit